MKRYGNLWDKICSRSNLEIAANNALHNKKLTKERNYFIKNRDKLLSQLEENLINQTYN